MAFQSPSQKDLLNQIVFHADAHVNGAQIRCREETRAIQVPQPLSLQPQVQLSVWLTQSA